MKAKLLAVAIAAALPMVASAQSNVTMFGVVDTGLGWLKAGSNKQNAMTQDGISSSRFGVRGSEDLGGGLKANFWLESRIRANGNGSGAQNAPTGDAVDFSNRLAFVGLSGGWGSLNLGRQYTSAFINVHTAYDLFGTNGVGAVSNVTTGVASGGGNNGRLGSTSAVRSSNMIKYDSPNWSGFTLSAGFNLGERTNATGAERQSGFSLRYNPGLVVGSFGLQQPER
jgi:predicted porin